MTTIESRLARLEAIEEIKALKAQYCSYCDDDHDGASIARQFVPDGVWDGGREFGRHEGRAAIQAYFDGTRPKITFAAHLVMNPIITVDGPDLASGRWRLIMPCTFNTADGPEARWLLSSYDETYVRHDGQWLFKELKARADLLAPHLGGWA
jgi:hypothetical protein